MTVRDVYERTRLDGERTVRRLIAGLRRAGVAATVESLPGTMAGNYYRVSLDGRVANLYAGDGHVRFDVGFSAGRVAWYQVAVPKRRLNRFRLHFELVTAVDCAAAWNAVQDRRRNARAPFEAAFASIAADDSGHVRFSEVVAGGTARLDLWAYVTPEQATYILRAAVECGALRRKDG